MARKSRKNLPDTTVSVETPTFVAAGYVRLSVEDNRNKGDSIETQKAILQNYIAFEPDIELHDFYVDNGTTGTNFDRPAFNKMLMDAESGVINCIIVKVLSRLGRSAIDTGYYIEKYLPSIKVRFIAVNDDFDTIRDMDNGASVILPLKNMINEAYALDIGRKIRAQQYQAMQSGDFVGARPPYGYIKAPDNCHRLVVDPEAADVVRWIYDLAYGKAGLNTIVRKLNEAGIEPPNIYSQRKGIINFRNLRSNNQWQTFSVNRILSDEAYVGDMVQGKSQSLNRKQVKTTPDKWIIVHDTHEPLVSREVFTAVQEYRREVSDKSIASTVNPYTPNIFKGKVFCGHCGMPLHRQRSSRRKMDDVYFFHCLSNSRIAHGSCKAFHLPEKEMIASLLAMIGKHTDAVIGKTLRLRKNSEGIEAERDAGKSELVALRQDADKIGRMVKSLYESLVNGLITAEEYRVMRESYEVKAQVNLNRFSEIENRQIELDKQIAEFCELSDLIENNADGGITGDLVERLIENIRVYADRHIEVDFRFESGFELIEEVVV